MHTVVERELELKLVLSPERSIPVPARLTYRTDDPFAVHITFHIGSDSPVNWTFARELLVEGVFRPCGHGDVRIWPTKVERPQRHLHGAELARRRRAAGGAVRAGGRLAGAHAARWSRRAPRPSSSASTTGSPSCSPRPPADDLWLRDPWPSDESADGEV